MKAEKIKTITTFLFLLCPLYHLTSSSLLSFFRYYSFSITCFFYPSFGFSLFYHFRIPVFISPFNLPPSSVSLPLFSNLFICFIFSQYPLLLNFFFTLFYLFDIPVFISPFILYLFFRLPLPSSFSLTPISSPLFLSLFSILHYLFLLSLLQFLLF